MFCSIGGDTIRHLEVLYYVLLKEKKLFLVEFQRAFLLVLYKFKHNLRM
jgi:hypothetical protein